MKTKFRLQSHQRYPQIKFAYVDGHHDFDFDVHSHDFSELFLVVSGSGKHTVASHTYPLSTGDVFVINGDIEHGFCEVNKLKIVNLMFDTALPFFEVPSMRQMPGYQALFKIEPIARQASEYQAKLTLSLSQLKRVNGLLQQIKSEYDNAEQGFEIILTSTMQQLAIELARRYQEQTHSLPKTTLALSRALAHIDHHYKEVGLDTETIAQAAYISKRQLERLFRQFLNTSPSQYVKDLQIRHSATLLLNDNKSIQHIAESCGFSDSNYFSKCFKAQNGCSPREFRKKHSSHRAEF
ncbi:AraC family transcriptional regulator [Vibrio chagasii]|uniref:helix-turn-helix domain-containing protein n=1 Tax=Vibrio TaxID=662 RepID=UPI000CF526AD|nr:MULTISPECIES: helix-turn-helix domain-containing protein [Vibrio]MDE9379869.1 helix-turn-helix domain-containing protein [Vibrio alginolyticus]MCG9566422.1 helix-turn-helix domain-containing protein [Vibrio chagasii]MCG9604872.1 helix-turn-helix domain-containing protein [Vibrio chagasii]MCG9672441.1 helix-turn-helix domain-containing protein [Vibrio chagasii]NOI41384.1 helix-turn-helix domain-containing protein [Vibrio sp. 070316B]